MICGTKNYRLKVFTKKLAKFLHTNAILRLNDEIIEYLKHFIREEQMKQKRSVVQGFHETMESYNQEIQMF